MSYQQNIDMVMTTDNRVGLDLDGDDVEVLEIMVVGIGSLLASKLTFQPYSACEVSGRLVKLEQARGFDIRSAHGDNGNSSHVCQQVAFQLTTVLVITRSFLLSKSGGLQGLLFYWWEH